MLKDVYFEQLIWVIPMLLIDLIVPIVTFIPKLRKKDDFKLDGDFIGFVITMLVANGLVSYIIGIFGYVRLDDSPIRSYSFIWIIAFLLLVVAEGVIYYLWIKRETKASIEISMSPNDYKELILSAEKGAKVIWFMPKRIHVMFKSQAFIHYLAERRFGIGSEYIQAYEDEHIDRKAELYRGLNNGMIIHELHNKNDLISYIKKKSHHGVENIEKQYFIEMLTEWKRVLRQFPSNYCARLTDENILLKYELIDKKTMVIHESVGSDGRDRLNAILIENPVIVRKISNDFSQVWERVPPNDRNNQSVIDFIDSVLLPLLN